MSIIVLPALTPKLSIIYSARDRPEVMYKLVTSHVEDRIVLFL